MGGEERNESVKKNTREIEREMSGREIVKGFSRTPAIAGCFCVIRLHHKFSLLTNLLTTRVQV